ncbi:NAC domain containing protein [Parasponia andersonii]|uniref:NAC domain containing protein n=1 Tax=Parasponia andersonii TaxID=3476 RepID=A0A2P5CVN5_PARAD|nr:NAC domain containing protein [Parasponia andersonii]
MENPNAASFSLPPGSRFHPSEEELLGHYLRGKNANPNGVSLIKELDLYGYDPFELPEGVGYPYGRGGKKRHWFCYTAARAVNRKSREKRRARNGYWRKKGRTTGVMGPGGNDVLGTKTSFVYYLGRSTKSAVRTDWVLYEYAAANDHQASFVLCRVFFKPRTGNRLSGNGFIFSAEESGSAVHHIGIQLDGSVTQDYEVDGQTVTRQAPITLIGCTITVCNIFVERNAQEDLSLTNNSAMNTDASTSEDVLSIVKNDYLEVDDLAD